MILRPFRKHSFSSANAESFGRRYEKHLESIDLERRQLDIHAFSRLVELTAWPDERYPAAE